MSTHDVDRPVVNSAHKHAADADNFWNEGLFIPAAEHHQKAADLFLEAANKANENHTTKRALLMLYSEHKKASSDAERKISKLREDGKDPSIAHKPETPKKRSAGPVSTRDPSRTSSPPPRPFMAESPEGTVDESFMLLGGQRSDPGDAFNNWWNTVQAKFDQHSEAVAFASSPLSIDSSTPPGTASPPIIKELQQEQSLGSDTDLDEPIVARLTKRFGLTKDCKHTNQLLTPEQQKAVDDLGDGIFDEGDELSESFFVVPSDREPSAAHLKKENISLIVENDSLRRRLEAAEKVLQVRKDQDQQLRDSVYQATREIAQRTMGASINLSRQPIDPNPSPVPLPGYQTAREAQYARRVKELEEDLRALKTENEKHKAMIVKFRDQWEKLKENAKRKKEEKAKAAVREQISEEPEPVEEKA